MLYKLEFFQDILIHKSQFGKTTLTGSEVVRVSELKRPRAAGDGWDGIFVAALADSARSPVVRGLSEHDLQCLGKSRAIHLHFTNSSGSTAQAEQIRWIMKAVVLPGSDTTCFPFLCVKENTEPCL